MTRVFIS